MKLIKSIIFICGLTIFVHSTDLEAKNFINSYDKNISDSIGVFTVDRRLELFNVIQWLSNTYPAKTKLNYKYLSELENYFDKYRTHEAVTGLDKLITFGFSYDAHISFFLHISPGLDSIYAGMPKKISDRAGGINNLKYFLGTVKAFAAESRFKLFFNNHIEFYRELVNGINNQYPVNTIIEQVESYYGTNIKDFNVILSTLTSGGFGPKVIGPDGKNIFVTVASPANLNDMGEIIFFKNKNSIQALLWHELSHPIVNPLVDKYWDKLSRYTNLIETMKKTAPNWYKNDKVIYYENIVRAVTIRMAYINEGKKQGEEDGKQQTS